MFKSALSNVVVIMVLIMIVIFVMIVVVVVIVVVATYTVKTPLQTVSPQDKKRTRRRLLAKRRYIMKRLYISSNMHERERLHGASYSESFLPTPLVTLNYRQDRNTWTGRRGNMESPLCLICENFGDTEGFLCCEAFPQGIPLGPSIPGVASPESPAATQRASGSASPLLLQYS